MAAPTRVDILPFIAGLIGPAQCTVFDAAKTLGADGTSHIHLVDRRAGGAKGDALRVAIGAPYHPVHCANAWDGARPGGAGSSDRVHLLASCWPPAAVRRLAESGSSLLGSWEDLRDGDFSDVPMTNLCRFVVDLNSSSVIEHTILASGCQLDHPKVNPQWTTTDSRFVFGTLGRHDNGGDEDATPLPPQSFGCVDVSADNGEGVLVDSWHAGERRLVDEATVVPMPATGDERAVWLIAPIFDGETRTTSYVVLDGRRLSEGPVCELGLPDGIFIPWALHGTWVGSGHV
jgi:carotenoid cleavage dioxygenase-like enzyme